MRSPLTSGLGFEGGAFEHKRPGAEADARSERRAGRTAQRDSLRPLTFRPEAVQNRYPPIGQELHHDAGTAPSLPVHFRIPPPFI